MSVGVDSCSLCNDSVITTIKSLMDSGKSLNMASKEVSKEVNEKLGYALYTAASIKQRYLRHTQHKVVRCVPHEQVFENNVNKKMECDREGGGRRENALRKQKTHKKPSFKSSRNHIVSKYFKDAFDNLWSIVFTEKAGGWRTTSRDAVLDHLNLLINEIEKGGQNV